MARALRLLAIFAHPDDETFRPGGSLALLARSGVQVHVLTITRGQTGSCGNPPLCSQDELPAVRESELRCACKVLGLEKPRLLDYRDGQLAEENLEHITSQIYSVIAEVRPQVMLTFGPDGLSGHPDHVATGLCVRYAYDRAENVAALYTLAVPYSLAQKFGMTQLKPIPDEGIALTVDISLVWDVKQKAMACHATQISSTPLMNAAEEQQRLFFGVEYFVREDRRYRQYDFMDKCLKI